MVPLLAPAEARSDRLSSRLRKLVDEAFIGR